MNRGRHQRTGWRGSFLFVLALIAAIGPSWAGTYLCPMARAESAKSRVPACCAHRQVTAATAGPSLRVACHCPIPTWQVGAVNQGLNRAEFVPAVSVAPAPAIVIVLSRTAPIANFLPRVVRASGPPLWVRNLSILC
jgi:hypothetical protein